MRDVVPMQPRVITIYYGWNDHWCAFGMEDKQIGRFYHAAAFTQLFSRSRVAQLIAKACFATPSEKMTPRKRVAIEDFRANLRAMVRIAKDHSIIPVLLTAPSAHQPGAEPPYLAKRQLTDLSELIPLHESYVQAVRDVAAEERVPMVDLYQLFRGLSREELARSFYSDGIHLTELGSRRIAQYLYDYCARTGLILDLIGQGGQTS